MSSKLELYIFPFSPPARAAWMTCKAVGVPVDIKHVNLFNEEQKKPEFLKINPQHTLPTLVDGDFVLWESRAIEAYIVDKYGGAHQSLYPKDVHKRAEVNRLLFYDVGTVWVGVLDNWVNKLHGKPPPPKEQVSAFHKSLDYIDNLLQDRIFLTGSDVTLADISTSASLSLWEPLSEDMSQWKNLLAWYQRMTTQPFWDECNQGLQQLKEYYQKKLETEKDSV